MDKPQTIDRAVIERIAIVGTGTIGASWAAYFLAHGFDVVAYDPVPEAGEALREAVADTWTALRELGLAPGSSARRLDFTTDLSSAVADADFIQECMTDRPETKVAAVTAIDALAPPRSIIASSSSRLTASALQAKCRHPERCVIGHTINPTHLIPLVEVVGGTKTSAETIRRAIAFYERIGKRPVEIRKDVTGHAANRLQAALFRELVYLIDEGVLDVAGADDVIRCGLGLRWAAMGPNLLNHLDGGREGIHQYMKHLPDRVSRYWENLGTPKLTEGLQQAIADGVLEEVGNKSLQEITRTRDNRLIAIIIACTKHLSS